jgi:ferric iron reductase protein FhuF
VPAPTAAVDRDAVSSALAEISTEIGCQRLDVCGQRLVELRAWELAAEAAPAALRDGGEARLAEGLADALAPLVEAVNQASGRPRSGLWRGASDRVAQALVLAGEEAGDPGRGEAAARRALGGDGPLAGPVRIIDLNVDGNAERVQLRNGCCLWHRIPGEPKCSTCPLLPAGERADRVRAEREESG